MKNFKELSSAQKKRAVDQAIDLNAKELAKGSGGRSFGKLSAKKQQELLASNGKFCGCYGCITFVRDTMKRDNELKEFVLGEAMVEAENAYYKEKDETVLDVD